MADETEAGQMLDKAEEYLKMAAKKQGPFINFVMPQAQAALIAELSALRLRDTARLWREQAQRYGQVITEYKDADEAYCAHKVTCKLCRAESDCEREGELYMLRHKSEQAMYAALSSPLPVPSAAPEAEALGRELIQWAANKPQCYEYSFVCSFCGCELPDEAENHKSDCLHLRAWTLLTKATAPANATGAEREGKE